MTKKFFISKLISRVFDAPVAMLLMFYLIWSKAPLDSSIPNIYFIFALIYLLLVPILIIVLLIQIDVLDNWELTDRKTRKYAYLIGFAALILTLVSGYFFQVPNYFINYIYLALIIVVIYGIITNFTTIKISLHISTWTGVIFFLSSFLSLWFLLLSPLILLIGYARYTIRNHTLTDMFTGFYLTLIILFPFLVLTNI